LYVQRVSTTVWLPYLACAPCFNHGVVGLQRNQKKLDGRTSCSDAANPMSATAASGRILSELSTTVGGLAAAIEMDIDRTNEDRAFFTNQRATLQACFDKVFEADQAVTKHLLLVHVPRQAAIVVGDNVLDRGVRAAKARMRLELKTSAMPGGEDHVFPSDISEITDAERRVEPNLVLGAVAKFDQVPDFNGKAGVKTDLEKRVGRQQMAFQQRDAGETAAEALDGALDRAVAEGDEALFVCERHLEARFPRDAKYVASFFLEKPSRKKKKVSTPAPVPANEPATG
jgi:hypothetical protein